MKPLATWAAALALVASAGSAQAALTDLGDGTVLDTATNIVWLKDWTLIGISNSDAQYNKIAALVTAGHDNWIVPTMAEYGQLRLDAGGTLAGVQANFTINSDENWGIDANGFSAIFHLSSGISHRNRDIDNYGAGARLDQLYVAAVPEPQSLALVLLALGAGAFAARRRSA